MTLWLCVDLDNNELPLVVADTATELSQILGVSVNTIHSCVCHSKKSGYRSRYVKVEVEDE